MNKWSNTDFKIKSEIEKSLAELGASIDLLATVGSWKDTLDDEHILELLQEHNKSGTIWKKIYKST